jgi:hypothetical protein
MYDVCIPFGEGTVGGAIVFMTDRFRRTKQEEDRNRRGNGTFKAEDTPRKDWVMRGDLETV